MADDSPFSFPKPILSVEREWISTGLLKRWRYFDVKARSALMAPPLSSFSERKICPDSYAATVTSKKRADDLIAVGLAFSSKNFVVLCFVSGGFLTDRQRSLLVIKLFSSFFLWKSFCIH